MKAKFLEEIKQQVLVCDGAMGTMLYGRGIFINRCFDELNLSRPQVVQQIHEGYVRSGAQIIETNTFGANRVKLSGFGLAEKTGEINASGARLATASAGESTYVAGAIGPLGIRIEPWGKTSVDEAREIFREQVAGLLEGGVDLFVLETFADLDEIHAAILAVRDLSELPLVAQMTLEEDGNNLEGTPPEIFGRRLDEWGADVIGLNCSVGPQIMLESVQRIAEVTSKPLSAQPNAGMPRKVEGRNIYLCSPEYMARYAKRFVRSGVKIIGGCCGTTPEHIRLLRRSVREGQEPRARISPVTHAEERQTRGADPVAAGQKSGLSRLLRDREFVRIVEIVPPRGFDGSACLEGVRKLRAAGVNAVSVLPGPPAGARMSAQALALLLTREEAVEPVLNFPCRQRGLLSMQSDLLGLYALGLRNLMLITGDPPKQGDYQDATAIHEVDSIGLTNAVRYLNQGIDVGGNRLAEPTGFLIGVAANPNAVSLDEEIRRFEYKVEAGAEFCITQPVFDPRVLERFLKRVEHCRIPVIGGVWPLLSHRNAEFMNNELPGVVVPNEVLKRMEQAENENRARQEGIELARETARHIESMLQGLQVAAPEGRLETALEVLTEAGRARTPVAAGSKEL